jgi:hypothetical protein
MATLTEMTAGINLVPSPQNLRSGLEARTVHKALQIRANQAADFLWLGVMGSRKACRFLVIGLPTRYCPATFLEGGGQASITRSLTMTVSQAETARKFDSLYSNILTVEGLVTAARLIADNNNALFQNTRENVAITGLLDALTGITKQCTRIAAELHDEVGE